MQINPTGGTRQSLQLALRHHEPIHQIHRVCWGANEDIRNIKGPQLNLSQNQNITKISAKRAQASSPFIS